MPQRRWGAAAESAERRLRRNARCVIDPAKWIGPSVLLVGRLRRRSVVTNECGAEHRDRRVAGRVLAVNGFTQELGQLLDPSLVAIDGGDRHARRATDPGADPIPA